MSIKEYINELTSLQKEIKHNNARNRELKTRVKNIEAHITDYLQIKDQTGLKYNGQAILLESKPKYTIKPPKEKKDDVKTFLTNLGVNDIDVVYEQLLDAQRGGLIDQQKLKFKKLLR